MRGSSEIFLRADELPFTAFSLWGFVRVVALVAEARVLTLLPLLFFLFFGTVIPGGMPVLLDEGALGVFFRDERTEAGMSSESSLSFTSIPIRNGGVARIPRDDWHFAIRFFGGNAVFDGFCGGFLGATGELSESTNAPVRAALLLVAL